MAILLEYLAFAMSLLSVYFYGHYPKLGPLVGMITALLFMAWGTYAEVYAAALSNIAFLLLHFKNLVKVNPLKSNL